MFVEKCKRVVMEERRGRHHAHRMAREMSDVIHNPIGHLGRTVNTVAGEDMGPGAKVLLLLVGAGVVGGGIYYLATKPATAVAPVTTVPANATTTVATPTGTIAVPARTDSAPAGTTLAQMVANAVQLATLARTSSNPGAELGPAAAWAAWAKASGATAAQLAQLRAAGFAV
jgi:hypothetical protein